MEAKAPNLVRGLIEGERRLAPALWASGTHFFRSLINMLYIYLKPIHYHASSA